MSQFLGFGDGSDGDVTLSGTDAPIDSSCSGNSGSKTLTATNASFAAGQMVLIIQMRGSNAGKYELNKIASYVAGTITLTHNLVNIYSDSGADQAQVIVLKQYRGVTISATRTAKAWNGNVGGVLAIACTGKVNITGKIDGQGKGHLGGSGVTLADGKQAEGTDGAGGTATTDANGTGGGGGDYIGGQGAGGGGGGGHATSGTSGSAGNGVSGGTGGGTDGEADLTEMIMGGGGGSGGAGTGATSGDGGAGGAIIMIFANEIDCSSGDIDADGGDGGVGSQTGSYGGSGGGGGGSVLLKATTLTVGTNKITVAAGNKSSAYGSNTGNGGNGGVGRIRLEACTITGSTTPSASESEGGHDWCGGDGHMI